MIVVKIELHSARTGKVTELGRMLITNDGTSDNPDRGNYDIKLGRKGQDSTLEVYQKPFKIARIENYPRKSYPVWELIKRAVNLVRE
jgi:hypothetical protein